MCHWIRFVRVPEAGKSWTPEKIQVNTSVHVSSLPIGFASSAVFLRFPLCPSTPPAYVPVSVGVNLSPRLSPNTELYKLKPISLRRGPGVATRATLFSFICCRQTCLVFFAAAKQPAATAISCLHAWLHGNVKEDSLRMRARLYESLSYSKNCAYTPYGLFHVYDSVHAFTCVVEFRIMYVRI